VEARAKAEAAEALATLSNISLDEYSPIRSRPASRREIIDDASAEDIVGGEGALSGKEEAIEEAIEEAMEIEKEPVQQRKEDKWLPYKGLLLELFRQMVLGGDPNISEEAKEADFLLFVAWLCELEETAIRYIPATCRLRWLPGLSEAKKSAVNYFKLDVYKSPERVLKKLKRGIWVVNRSEIAYVVYLLLQRKSVSDMEDRNWITCSCYCNTPHES